MEIAIEAKTLRGERHGRTGTRRFLLSILNSGFLAAISQVPISCLAYRNVCGPEPYPFGAGRPKLHHFWFFRSYFLLWLYRNVIFQCPMESCLARVCTSFRISWRKAYDVKNILTLFPIDFDTITVGIHASEGHIVGMFFNVVNLHPLGAHATM